VHTTAAAATQRIRETPESRRGAAGAPPARTAERARKTARSRLLAGTEGRGRS
jgi:hypothetical protein